MRTVLAGQQGTLIFRGPAAQGIFRSTAPGGRWGGAGAQAKTDLGEGFVMNRNRIFLRRGLQAMMLGFCAVFLFASLASAQWKPRKPIKMVVMAGKGGGAGKLSRLFQGIIAEGKFSSQPFIPDYKPGGSGAEALVYMKGRRGDAHTVMFTLNSYFTTPLRQPKLGVDIARFTPIARMGLDTFVLWVNKSAGITDLNGFIRAVKSKGKGWNMGGTGRAQEDQLLTNLLETTFGLKMTYTPFKGGGTVAKNLAGNHLNSTVNNPSEAIGWWEGGKVVPLAAFTAERLKLFPNVPTFAELGYSGMDYFMMRSVTGPPEMPQEAVDYYVEVFRKVHNAQKWKDYVKKKAMFRAFMTGDEFQGFLLTERGKHRKMLIAAGEL